MVKPTIAVVTGSRAEYGLLSRLIALLEKEPDFRTTVIVTGSHLAPHFGMTVSEIIEDGHDIGARVEMLLDSDTPEGVTTSTGLGLIGLGHAYATVKPDAVLLLGDRFEILAAATAALIAGIPVAHIHGGETPEGAIDEAIRHSITKMSILHFVSTDDHRRRVIQLGEDPSRVFNVGALGVDNVKALTPMPLAGLEERLGIAIERPAALVVLHPETMGDSGENAPEELLAALESSDFRTFCLSLPNADTGYGPVRDAMLAFAAERPGRAVAFESLGRQGFLSLLHNVDAIVGNSSSGLIEAPAVGVPTVNVGDRQRGRTAPDSVLHCAASRDAISEAIRTALSPEFRESAARATNPYGDGRAGESIVAALKDAKPWTMKPRKAFYDLPPEGG